MTGDYDDRPRPAHGTTACRERGVDAAAAMDHRLRRLSAILWAVAILVCLLATNTALGQGYNRLGINLLLMPSAIIAVAVVWRFPWHRYDRDAFLVTTIAALVLLPLLVGWSGGWQSPFTPYYFFIIVFAALYYRRRVALLVTLAATLDLAAPLLFGFAPPGGGRGLAWFIVITGTTALAIVIVARLMADELRRLYGETLERLHTRWRAEAALQRANEELEERVAARTTALRYSEERYRDLFDNASDLVYTHDLAGRITAINKISERLTGYTQAEALDLHLHQMVASEDWPALMGLGHQLLEGSDIGPAELHIVAKDGRRVPVEVSTRLILDEGRPAGVQGIARDITERKRFEAALRHQAFHDPLTGLPNRALFLDRLEQALGHARRRPGYRFAVLFLDLDRFKTINDSLGHAAGDALLTAMAHRLGSCLRSGDTVARLGGDEFAILLDDLDTGTIATDATERLVAASQLPFVLDGQQVYTAASIGVVLGPDGYRQTEDLLRDADTAMYRAKAAGKARYAIFAPDMHAHALAILQLEHDLRRALERQEFCLHYQPIVALATGHLQGFEALVRWQHPERGLVPPSAFVSIAEDAGLIVPLGWWVLEAACAQAWAWQRAYPEAPCTMSVNLSAKQLTEPDLVDRVARALQASGLPGNLLQLELTESAIMENAAAAAGVLARLQALGVQLAVDDFGTGYSSLAYLKRFSLDTLKIDKAFVDGLGTDPNDTAIVRAIVSLAYTLGLEVTAEGVETEAQAAQLRTLGCGSAQGYHFGKPLAAAGAAALLDGMHIAEWSAADTPGPACPAAPPSCAGVTQSPPASSSRPKYAVPHRRVFGEGGVRV